VGYQESAATALGSAIRRLGCTCASARESAIKYQAAETARRVSRLARRQAATLATHQVRRPRGNTAARSECLVKPPFAPRVDLTPLVLYLLKTRDSVL
jgi:hypothetical protein